jgi:hypothetical protein
MIGRSVRGEPEPIQSRIARAITSILGRKRYRRCDLAGNTFVLHGGPRQIESAADVAFRIDDGDRFWTAGSQR